MKWLDHQKMNKKIKKCNFNYKLINCIKRDKLYNKLNK